MIESLLSSTARSENLSLDSFRKVAFVIGCFVVCGG